MYVCLRDKRDVQYERQDPWFTGPADEEDER